VAKNPTIEELEQSLKIDKHDLDNGLSDNREVYWHVAKAAVEANSIYEGIKLEIKELHAELDEEFRQKAIDDGEKVTETGLINKIISSDAMRNARKRELAAKKQSELLDALKESASIRGYDLRKLADLWTQQYFVAESGGKQRQEAVDRTAQRNREETGQLRRERRVEKR
jgi:hypothetical protein